MPLLFLFLGILLVVVAINNKLSDLGLLAKNDFQGEGSTPGFALWVAAIFAVGAIGFSKSLKPLANAFLVLIVLAMLLSNKGFFANFTKSIKEI